MADPLVEAVPEVERLRALLDAATERPWAVGDEGHPTVECEDYVVADVPSEDGCGDADADAALIVEAVNALPELLASVDRVQVLTEALSEARSQIALRAHVTNPPFGHPCCVQRCVCGKVAALAAIDAALNPGDHP